MNEKLKNLLLQIIQEALDKKHARLTFSIVNGRIEDVELVRRKIKAAELVEAQKD